MVDQYSQYKLNGNSGSIILGSHMFFSCINICRVLRILFEHEVQFKHLPRDPASVYALKQTCVIVILAYFTLFQPNSH